MMSGFVGSTVMAWTLVPSGSPLVSCSQPPSPTRRKIPGRLPDVNEPTPTYTRDGLDGFAMVVSFRRTFRRYDSTPGQTWPAIGGKHETRGEGGADQRGGARHGRGRSQDVRARGCAGGHRRRAGVRGARRRGGGGGQGRQGGLRAPRRDTRDRLAGGRRAGGAALRQAQ